MYTPKYHQVQDQEEMKSFIKENSFGTFISNSETYPMATHLPFDLEEREESIYLSGHFAYANPHWKVMEKNPEVLITFLGPHSYVSPSWYSHENVPTWNYTSVHAYGKTRIIEGHELKDKLSRMLKKYEGHRDNPVLWEKMNKEFLEKEIKGIVGFEVKVGKLVGSYKLSQNRNAQDFSSIISHLEREGTLGSKEVASNMRKLKRDEE